MVEPLFPQLPLNFHIHEEFTFDNFLVGENIAAKEQLISTAGSATQSFVYIWGSEGVGCSHLLQACCHQASCNNRTAMYLPLDELNHHDGSIVEGIEAVDLVCVDHLDTIAGNLEWETALFHLFNRLQVSNSQLIVASTSPPRRLDITLADLVSRLSACLVYQIAGLNDDDIKLLLQQKAKVKGLELSADAVQFIMNRCERSLPSLFKLLEDLDHNALSAGRRLTVPFIKDVMKW